MPFDLQESISTNHKLILLNKSWVRNDLKKSDHWSEMSISLSRRYRLERHRRRVSVDWAISGKNKIDVLSSVNWFSLNQNCHRLKISEMTTDTSCLEETIDQLESRKKERFFFSRLGFFSTRLASVKLTLPLISSSSGRIFSNHSPEEKPFIDDQYWII